jgi:LacI family transcriptional regulator
MKSGGVTLHAVAVAAGVTIATASRSLNNAYGVHPDTRARVLQVAARLNYTPNRFARGLVTGRSNMIGLVVSDIRNPYFAEVARGVEDAALEAGRDVLLCNSDLSSERQMRAVASLLDKRADGIIMHSVTNLPPAHQAQIAAAGVPIVLLNRAERGSVFSTVAADNDAGGRLAAQCLLRHGHRNVIHLTGPRRHANLLRRAQGFQKQMATVPGTKVRIIHATHTLEGAYQTASTLLHNLEGATAISTGNDAIAFGVMKSAIETGIRIPRDLSIIGFDDVELAAMTFPPLTTIHQPKYDVGRAALEMLTQMLTTRSSEPRHREVEVHLVERASVRTLSS